MQTLLLYYLYDMYTVQYISFVSCFTYTTFFSSSKWIMFYMLDISTVFVCLWHFFQLVYLNYSVFELILMYVLVLILFYWVLGSCFIFSNNFHIYFTSYTININFHTHGIFYQIFYILLNFIIQKFK